MGCQLNKIAPRKKIKEIRRERGGGEGAPWATGLTHQIQGAKRKEKNREEGRKDTRATELSKNTQREKRERRGSRGTLAARKNENTGRKKREKRREEKLRMGRGGSAPASSPPRPPRHPLFTAPSPPPASSPPSSQASCNSTSPHGFGHHHDSPDFIASFRRESATFVPLRHSRHSRVRVSHRRRHSEPPGVLPSLLRLLICSLRLATLRTKPATTHGLHDDDKHELGEEESENGSGSSDEDGDVAYDSLSLLRSELRLTSLHLTLNPSLLNSHFRRPRPRHPADETDAPIRDRPNSVLPCFVATDSRPKLLIYVASVSGHLCHPACKPPPSSIGSFAHLRTNHHQFKEAEQVLHD